MKAANEANRAKTQFFSSMSHDMRTPMNAIMGFTHIARKHVISDETRSCLEKIDESSEHLLSLINDVLDISHIESGALVIKPAAVDLNEMVGHMEHMAHSMMVDRDLTLTGKRTATDRPWVMADVDRIQDVLMHILGNAVKFTPDGGVIRFDTRVRNGADRAHVVLMCTVGDTGIGINPEFLAHIYEPFAQENMGARTHYQGTGLGMAITKKYVDMLGGTISVVSEKGKGTTVTVTFPLEITDADSVQSLPAVQDKLNGIRVLLAEDNELNAELAAIQLEEAGMQVTHAPDGAQAVAMFRDHPAGTYDVILMDIMMPNMNGYEATRAIRAMEGRPDGQRIPILAVTANAFAEDVQASISAGMNGHLSKPLVMGEVTAAIARNL
ncbi:MAG: ATP-binding protein [Clostridia bacterium]|nr:ATP-binding protein [Clostridia bacterium]